MHVHGMGEAVALAKALRSALAASRTPTAIPTAAATETLALDIKAMDAALRAPGKVVGGTYEFAFPRAEQINEDGASIPPSIGLATAINFQPTTQGRAVATGDFVLIGTEVTPVLSELRQHGIEVTAIHNHLTDEQPRLFFMHFWGNGQATVLGSGLRAALDHMNLAAPPK